MGVSMRWANVSANSRICVVQVILPDFLFIHPSLQFFQSRICFEIQSKIICKYNEFLCVYLSNAGICSKCKCRYLFEMQMQIFARNANAGICSKCKYNDTLCRQLLSRIVAAMGCNTNGAP